MADTTGNENLWAKLKPKRYEASPSPVKNANQLHETQLSPLDRFAIKITDRVGSMGFFIIIFVWTVVWCGYNILATEVPGLHLAAFDPFPAFVAYLLISNVIQILLMPLIMVGQNLQGKHSEIRAELDFEINKKAEQEVMVILRNLEHNTDLLIQLMQHMDCRLSEDELKVIAKAKELDERVTKMEMKSED